MFIVCGEALFDVFATGHTATGIGFDGRIGGSPFNVALGLARLGQPVGFCGGIGTGFAGERLMQALHDEGIDSRAVARLDAPTTLSLIGLDAQGVPSYAFYGQGCADRLLQPAHLAAIPAEANGLPLRQLCHGGGAGGGHPARAGGARAPAQPDQLRPQHPQQCRARPGRVARQPAMDAAAHPSAEGQ